MKRFIKDSNGIAIDGSELNLGLSNLWVLNYLLILIIYSEIDVKDDERGGIGRFSEVSFFLFFFFFY